MGDDHRPDARHRPACGRWARWPAWRRSASTQPPPVSATPVAPDEAAAQGQDRARVLAALKQLPPEQREVVELAYFEGLSQREIAERTGDPLGTVKTRARLALEKLSLLLEARPAPVSR